MSKLKMSRTLLSTLKSSQSVGLLSLIAVMLMWLISSMLTEGILASYDKPLLMTYASVISMQIYFVFLKVRDPLMEYLKSRDPKQSRISISNEKIEVQEEEPISLRETAKIASRLFLVYSLGLYFANSALNYTTVGPASILNATGSIFTLLLGSFFKVERFTVMKVAAVVVTFFGVAVNSYPSFKENSNTKNPIWGNLFPLLGAFCYACFLIFLQKQTRGKTGLNRPILFAFIGLFTMIFCWPLIIFLHFLGKETLEAPPNLTIVVFLILKVILGSVIPSYLCNVTYALTSPLYIAVGTSLTVPLSIVADYIFHKSVSSSNIIGAVFVTAGCFIMNLAEMQ